MDNNKKFWQRVAGFYTRFESINEPLYENISRKIIPSLNSEMKVLELACGSGQLTFRLADYVKVWEATDFSPAMIEQAKKKKKKKSICFSVQDATNLPYEKDSFDVVLIANALHIMPRPNRALNEIFRVLKPGGFLFAPTFIWRKNAGFQLCAWLIERLGFKVFNKWNQEELIQFVEDKGFIIKAHSIMGSNITPLCYLASEKPRSKENII